MVDGKVVVVTGAGSGIGRDFAMQFAQSGAKVVVNDIARVTGDDGFAADAVVNEITAAGGDAKAVIESVSEWSSAQKIVQSALDHFGKLDAVINNAGVTRDRFFFNMSVEEWNTVIDVHLNGSFFVARAAAPHFKSRLGGAFVHRQPGSVELCGRKNGPCRLIQNYRSRYGKVQCPIELHCTLGVDRNDSKYTR
jgi:NAD(P)-dependent dehydrogenase (short-subunit alcohol dehydrogenase family)